MDYHLYWCPRCNQMWFIAFRGLFLTADHTCTGCGYSWIVYPPSLGYVIYPAQ